MPTPPRTPADAVRFEGATPILRVRSLDAAIDHYVRALGFAVGWRDGQMAYVSRDRVSLMLCEGDQGHTGGWVWIGVEDAGALHAEYRTRGANIRHAPTNYPWAFEMQVEDLDGNVLRFGSEPRADMPVGEWLDGGGKLWVQRPEGGWAAAG